MLKLHKEQIAAVRGRNFCLFELVDIYTCMCVIVSYAVEYVCPTLFEEAYINSVLGYFSKENIWGKTFSILEPIMKVHINVCLKFLTQLTGLGCESFVSQTIKENFILYYSIYNIYKVKGTHITWEVFIGGIVPEKFLPRVLLKMMIHTRYKFPQSVL